jgi:bacteriorhodopsin|tara:strand:- start:49 stop:822 length:774 start_codon:yes stop_codon:yes gene_type:complete
MFKNYKKLLATLVPASVLVTVPSIAMAAAGSLDPKDYVGISFWIISISMVAATAFFFLEAGKMTAKWRTSVVVSGLVTLVAAVHYFYMRDVWVATGTSPTVFRYVDWLITVPLLMVEFYFILAAVGLATIKVFWNLLIGTLVMLVGGYLGEVGAIDSTVGFVIGMIGWLYILYYIFAGDAGTAMSNASEGVQSAFKAMRLIVLIGWAIYPLGYLLGYMMGSVDANALNLIYNLADFVNKIAFGLLVWAAASSESAKG